MKLSLILPAILRGVATLTDKGVKITFVTNEVTPEVAGELYRLQNAFVFLAIKEEDFGREELEALENLETEFQGDNRKTASQRLRAVLYRNWEVDNKGYTDFNLFYLHELERIIDHYKKKLP